MLGRFLVTVCFAITCCWGTAVTAEILAIPGSGAGEEVLKDLAAAFNAQDPDHQVVVPASIGSNGGIRLVSNDQAQMARVSRPLMDKETHYGLDAATFAKDAVVFAVGARVGVRSLTTEQLVAIFSGKVSNWQEVGDEQAKVLRVLVREPDNTGLQVIQEHLAGFRTLAFTRQAKIIYHQHVMVEMLEKYGNAIGWLTQSAITDARSSIKPLAIHGILPTREEMQRGRYQLLIDYALVYKDKRLGVTGRRFLGFVFSDRGEEILKKRALLPVSRKPS
jgi:phosphate transport system substrate-binding protein